MSELDDFKIPPLPVVAVEVMKYNYGSPEAGADQMEKIIEPDRGVCTEILRIANSGFYGRPGDIRNVLEAVSLLGLKSIKNLVIYLSTKQLFSSAKSDVYNKYLHEYPITSALIARDIADKTSRSELSDMSFLAGLLHKIGMSIFAINVVDDYEAIIELAHTSDGKDLRDLELEKYQIDHIEMGKRAAEKWKLPEDLINLIGKGIMMENARTVNDLEEITICASWAARNICEIYSQDDDENIKKFLKDKEAIDITLLESFLDEEYVSELKSHPYYKLSSS